MPVETRAGGRAAGVAPESVIGGVYHAPLRARGARAPPAMLRILVSLHAKEARRACAVASPATADSRLTPVNAGF